MLIRLLRCVAVVVSGLAFLAGATVQALPPSDLLAPPVRVAMDASDAMADCPHLNAQAPHKTEPMQPMPCRGMTLDCMKWMGCIGFPSLPSPVVQATAPVEYGRVAYAAATSIGRGISIEPSLLPPIGA
jgi:hypothetical protein